ncbi:hypothetical protein ACH5RR_028474 [Cinchona calisaya]|uniref:Cytochrome P450 n=1 Tax=Cinchona calisaya TaxID=153742 RepID=A0ABD2YU70_9GENT
MPSPATTYSYNITPLFHHHHHLLLRIPSVATATNSPATSSYTSPISESAFVSRTNPNPPPSSAAPGTPTKSSISAPPQSLLKSRSYTNTSPCSIKAAASIGDNLQVETYIWYRPEPAIFIQEPELLREAAQSIHIFHKPQAGQFTKLLTPGLASYNGDKWAKHRKLINPAFNGEKLKNMLPSFYLSANEMMRKWEEIVSPNGSCELDVWPNLQSMTSDAISRTAFGSNYEEGRKIFELQAEQVEHCVKAIWSMFIPGWRTGDHISAACLDNDLMSRYQDSQARAREEVTMILYEVLRLYPPLPINGRITAEETKLGNLTVPSGMLFLKHIMLIHHDPGIWGADVKKFKPDRFSEGVSNATEGQAAFFPFGWGPRKCTGQNFALLEAKLVLVMILQRFSFELSHPIHMLPNQ